MIKVHLEFEIEVEKLGAMLALSSAVSEPAVIVDTPPVNPYVPPTTIVDTPPVTLPVTVDNSQSTETVEIAIEGTIPVTVEPAHPSPPITVDTAELDSDGQPWDARIHGKKRAKIGAGTWKLIRGIDQSIVDAVRAEYSAADVPAPPVSDVPAPPPNAPTTILAPVDTPPAPPVSADAPTPTTVTERITYLTSNKKLSVIDMMKLLKANGVQNIPDLNNHPESLQNIWDALAEIV